MKRIVKEMNPTISAPMPSDGLSSHERVMDIVLKQDDLVWKDLIYDLVRQEQMNPWDIDVSLLAQKFLEMINKLKEMDFRISGKIVLASSLLLKIKSDRLLLDDIAGLDNLINGPAEDFLEEDPFEFEQAELQRFFAQEHKLVPRTPQPRERKVSVHELVEALEQALELDAKRTRVLSRVKEEEVKAPTKSFDLSETMDLLQAKLRKLFTKSKSTILFHNLIAENTKQDKVFTFIPLLHLENQRKVDLAQKEHFGDIQVTLHNRKFIE